MKHTSTNSPTETAPHALILAGRKAEEYRAPLMAASDADPAFQAWLKG